MTKSAKQIDIETIQQAIEAAYKRAYLWGCDQNGEYESMFADILNVHVKAAYVEGFNTGKETIQADKYKRCDCDYIYSKAGLISRTLMSNYKWDNAS